MKITKQQLRRIIKEAVTSLAGADRYLGQDPLSKMEELATADPDGAGRFFDSAAEKAEIFNAKYGNSSYAKDAWAKEYEDHQMYVNVYSVPKDLFKHVFYYIAEEGMSVRGFQRAIMGL